MGLRQDDSLYSSDSVPDNLEYAELNSKDDESPADCGKKRYHADPFLRLRRASGRRRHRELVRTSREGRRRDMKVNE